MSKSKKKRNKKYSGIDAAQPRPKITRISAVSRSRASQWLFDNKKRLKFTLITGAIALVVTWIIFEIIRAIW